MSAANQTNITNCGEFASLIEAIAANSTTGVASLLAVGAGTYRDYVNAKDDFGRTPLMHSKSSEMTSLLLAAGANVNARDNQCQTALMLSKSSEITARLLEAGANVNANDRNGHTALMLSQSSEITSLLLTAGARVNTRDNNGHIALMWSTTDKMTTTLLEAGANINAKDDFGHTALVFAIFDGNEKQVWCLLAHGADMDTEDKQGETVLSLALNQYDLSLATRILAAGAKVEKEDRNIQEWVEWVGGRMRPGKKEKAALLLAAGAHHWLNLPTVLKPTPQELAEASERLRAARAELATERSRISLHAIRSRATQVCIALQGLGLPALVTLHILEELDEKARSVRMGALWALIVAVKHSRPEA